VTDVATIDRGEVMAEPTLDELTATVLREHGACKAAAQTTIEHAVRAGEALLQIREQLVGTEGWMRWLADNPAMHRTTAYQYMRLASYQRLIPEGTSLYRADKLIKSLPAIDGGPGRPHVEDGRKADARRMRDEGSSYKEIAKAIGASVSTVHAWFNDGTKDVRAKRARAALREQERAAKIRRAVKKTGGALAEAYAMAERLDDVLGQAHREATEPAAKWELAAAHELQRGMRDRIVRALGVEG
jgi:transposase